MARRPSPRNQVSFSAVLAFLQCPRRYRYRYRQGLPAPTVAVEAYLGQVVHEVMEWLYRQRDLGSIPSPVQLQAQLNERWDRGWHDRLQVPAGQDAARFRDRGWSMLRSYLEQHLPQDQTTTVALERRVALAILPGVHLTGKADRVARDEHGCLLVIDYKTSAPPDDHQERLEALQAPLYAACLMAHHNEDRARAGYLWLGQGTSNLQELDRDQAAAVTGHFRELTRKIMAERVHAPAPGDHCQRCAYAGICKASRVAETGTNGIRIGDP